MPHVKYSLPFCATLFSLIVCVFSHYVYDDTLLMQHSSSKRLFEPTLDSKIFYNHEYKSRSHTNSAQLKYMQTLFYRFKEDGYTLKGGNTVKTLRPVIDKNDYCDGQIGLMFPLDFAKSDDQLMHADLHFYKPPLKYDRHKLDIWKTKKLSHNLPKPLKIEAIVDCNSAIELNRTDNAKQDWVSFDAKKAFEETLHRNQSTLFIKISHNNRSLSAKQLTHLLQHQLPFLTIFTNAALTKNKIGIFDVHSLKTDPILSLKRTKRGIQDSSGNEEKLNKRRNSGKRQTDGGTYYSYDMTENKTSRKAGPLVPKLRAQFQTFRSTGPKLLTPRKQKNRSRKVPYYNPLDPMMGFGRKKSIFAKPNRNPFSTSTRLPFEDSTHINEINLDTTNLENDLTVMLLDNEKPNTSKEMCKRHSMTINFRDIGWSKWIIAPEFFEAGYCAGSCDHPLSKATNPSNHAIMQSLLRASGPQNSHLPQPCCAPDAMDSLTLLYYDENDNVVLKNYPNMIINSCGCI